MQQKTAFIKIWTTLKKELGEDHATAAKKALCETVSNGRTDSLKSLTYAELMKAVAMVDPETATLDRQRKKVIGTLREAGFEKFDTKRRTMVADMEAIGAWVEKFGAAKKPLNNHSTTELSILITQAEKLRHERTRSR